MFVIFCSISPDIYVDIWGDICVCQLLFGGILTDIYRDIYGDICVCEWKPLCPPSIPSFPPRQSGTKPRATSQDKRQNQLKKHFFANIAEIFKVVYRCDSFGPQ